MTTTGSNDLLNRVLPDVEEGSADAGIIAAGSGDGEPHSGQATVLSSYGLKQVVASLLGDEQLATFDPHLLAVLRTQVAGMLDDGEGVRQVRIVPLLADRARLLILRARVVHGVLPITVDG